ncbi:ABC transporter ATP-binding protein [Granulosicoccaceae sp. 1_MG-2023]|nr:ABC transporter ATP-binding protein [Granulosicoccaceae sp. 1_MG-2023]
MTGLSIEVQEKRFDALAAPVIGPLSLSLAEGEFVCLIGPSGSGKSTLLSMIAGLDRQWQGRVSLAGDAPPGFLFQEPRLMPWLTVADNIELVCAEPSRPRTLAMLDRVGLSDAAGRFPSELSGGMQRRVAVARAFINRPPVLLLDEPFVSLDAPAANQLRRLLESLWLEYKPTVLFVTHDLAEAIAMGDRLVFLGRDPAHIIKQLRVDLPRPRELTGTAVTACLQALLGEHPDLLSGRL